MKAETFMWQSAGDREQGTESWEQGGDSPVIACKKNA
jgi:hypothetical protein